MLISRRGNIVCWSIVRQNCKLLKIVFNNYCVTNPKKQYIKNMYTLKRIFTPIFDTTILAKKLGRLLYNKSATFESRIFIGYFFKYSAFKSLHLRVIFLERCKLWVNLFYISGVLCAKNFQKKDRQNPIAFCLTFSPVIWSLDKLQWRTIIERYSQKISSYSCFHNQIKQLRYS